MEEFLKSTFYFDSDSPVIRQFAEKHTAGLSSEIEKAKSIYLAVRDGLRYDPYNIRLFPEDMQASRILQKGFGFCVAKAVVLTAVARAANIPASIGFANVKNHLNSKRLQSVMKTDIFAFHGYTSLYLEGKWVKATPAFNLSLCERAKIKPLEFDGVNDSIFHAFDKQGNQHMEYLVDHGTFSDLPYEKMIDVYEEYYPHLQVKKNKAFGEFEKALFEEEVITG